MLILQICLLSVRQTMKSGSFVFLRNFSKISSSYQVSSAFSDERCRFSTCVFELRLSGTCLKLRLSIEFLPRHFANAALKQINDSGMCHVFLVH